MKNDQRLVIAGVGDDRLAGVRVAGHVVGVLGRREGVRDGGSKTLDLAVGSLDDQELVPVSGVVELRVDVGTPSVDGVEVIAGSAEIGRSVGVGLLLAEGRGVEGDVVVDELADEGEPRCQCRIRVLAEGVVVVLVGEDLWNDWLTGDRIGESLADDRLLLHDLAQVAKQRIRGRMRRLALEHEPEAALGGGAPGDQVHPAQLGAVGWHDSQLGGRL
jgi:hypothetical protein